jgi:hypothetical protein
MIDNFYENNVATNDGVIIVQGFTDPLTQLAYSVEEVQRSKGVVDGEGWSLS